MKRKLEKKIKYKGDQRKELNNYIKENRRNKRKLVKKVQIKETAD